MLKDLLNKAITITYTMGYSYAHKKGTVTKVNADFLMIDGNTLIAVKAIVKIVIKEK